MFSFCSEQENFAKVKKEKMSEYYIHLKKNGESTNQNIVFTIFKKEEFV